MEKISQFLLDQAIIWGPKIGIAIVVFLVFWVFSKIAYKAIVKVGGRTQLNTQIASFLARSAKITLIVFGIITALGTVGVNVSALVAGLGLTGFAFGFALKDTISNVLAGVLLLVYHPFEVNNRIKVSNHEGTVVSIDLRYTILDSEGTTVLIPNSKMFTNPIVILK